MSDEESIWIKTEPSVDGSTYLVTLEVSADLSVAITPDRALRYASAVLAAAQRAEYDAAVVRQLSNLVSDTRAVKELVLNLRQDRAPLDDEGTAPMRLEPGVNQKLEPFLSIFIGGRQVGQWDVSQARTHALFMLERQSVLRTWTRVTSGC